MKYLDSFLDHLKLNYRSKLTLKRYNYLLKKLKIYFNEKNIEDEKLITENHIIEYIKYLKENNTKNWFLSRMIQCLKRYFSFLVDSKIIFIDPTFSIEYMKEDRKRIKPVAKDELLASLENIKTDNDFGIRSKAIFELMYSTGIRPFELRNIKLNHIDFKKKELFIEKGKMNKDRVVPIGDTASYWLEKYIKEVRPKNLKDKSVNYLFITLIGKCKKLSDHGLSDAIKFTFKKYNIKRFKPYALRSSCATHLLLNGMDILHIQKLLGHESILTTKGYLDIKTLNLKDILNTKHPRNKY